MQAGFLNGVEVYGGIQRREWTLDGRVRAPTHRRDGPAEIWNNDIIQWYVFGNLCRSWADFQSAAHLSDEEMLILRIKYPHFDHL